MLFTKASCCRVWVTHNDGNVNVGSLLDSLGVGARVRDDDQARLLERAGDVVGEVTGSEATSDGDGAGVGGELEDSTLAIGTGGDDANCSPVSSIQCVPFANHVQVKSEKE